MRDSVEEWCGRVRSAYEGGRPVALLFDYDGTLTPIVAHPDLAVLQEPVRQTVRRLASIDRLAVGVISGRALADVVRKVGLGGLYYGGSSGAELDLRGVWVQAPLADHVREQLVIAHQRLVADVVGLPGVWVEPKPVGFTVHHRGAEEPTVLQLFSHFEAIMVEFPGLHYLSICEAFEVTPREGWNKATAVQQILANLPPGVLPVYFGDSLNDAPAMLACREAGGETIAIGNTPLPVARHRVESPERLHSALVGLYEMLITDDLGRRSVLRTPATSRSEMAARS